MLADVAEHQKSGHQNRRRVGNALPGDVGGGDDKSAPAKYRGIGIRIEDDVLVTEDGNVNLTSKVPKEAEAIEELMNNGKK